MADERASPAHGLFGPGIFGTGIDISALDPATARRLGEWTGQQIRAAYERGRLDGAQDALRALASAEMPMQVVWADESGRYPWGEGRSGW